MKTLAVVLLALLIWVGGLWIFASRVAGSTPAPDPPTADAIVALTGASTLRIEAAMELLDEGLGRRLLISGVNRETTRDQIRATLTAPGRAFDCCVDLGFEAENTQGNARESLDWVARHRYHSLIVVTADYHMPRALLELHAAMPRVTLHPYPVQTEVITAKRWWTRPEDARHMAVEYCKYLVILTRSTILNLGHRPGAESAAVSNEAGRTGVPDGGGAN